MKNKINKATLEFMESITNGVAFTFPVETEKGSDIDNFICNHPMFDKAIKKEHENFKNENYK